MINEPQYSVRRIRDNRLLIMGESDPTIEKIRDGRSVGEFEIIEKLEARQGEAGPSLPESPAVKDPRTCEICGFTAKRKGGAIKMHMKKHAKVQL